MVAIALLFSLVSYGQDIMVTVDKKMPAPVQSLDFNTILDEASVKALMEEGLDVNVKSALLSSGNSKYNCTVSGVTKEDYDNLDSRWRVQLSSGAEIVNAKVKDQEENLVGVYKTLLSEAKGKALPMALAMNKKLDKLESMELLDYSTIREVSPEDPFSGLVYAKIEVEYSCK